MERSRSEYLLVIVAVFLIWSLPLLMSSCREKAELSTVVGQVAKQYYDQMINGQYDAYVDGLYQPDSIPESYRLQLIDNAKMFMEQQRREHQGLREVSVVSATVDEDAQVADVFLLMTFGNGDTEQVLVPMIEHDGVWFMR